MVKKMPEVQSCRSAICIFREQTEITFSNTRNLFTLHFRKLASSISWHRQPCAWEHLHFPLSGESSRQDRVSVLRSSWECALEFDPQLILVSAGFDGYVHEPLCSRSLEIEDFHRAANGWGSARSPCAAILAGGYSDDLRILIDAFLSGWDSGVMIPGLWRNPRSKLIAKKRNLPLWQTSFLGDSLEDYLRRRSTLHAAFSLSAMMLPLHAGTPGAVGHGSFAHELLELTGQPIA
ncbi:MAG: hypothetical protein QOD99_1019 [Chthoniobacter sp.]|jgi:hypothetical protein|nr:hypothetical protein [Chthoniobacter sp.]